MLRNEVIKREVLEGDKAIEATKKINRSASKALRATPKAQASDRVTDAATTSQPEA